MSERAPNGVLETPLMILQISEALQESFLGLSYVCLSPLHSFVSSASLDMGLGSSPGQGHLSLVWIEIS